MAGLTSQFQRLDLWTSRGGVSDQDDSSGDPIENVFTVGKMNVRRIGFSVSEIRVSSSGIPFRERRMQVEIETSSEEVIDLLIASSGSALVRNGGYIHFYDGLYRHTFQEISADEDAILASTALIRYSVLPEDVGPA